MARRRSAKQQATEENPRHARGLEPAWSSSPHRPPRFELDCFNHVNERRWVVNSYGLYAIRKIFDAIVGNQEVDVTRGLRDGWKTACVGDIDLSSPELDAIMSHKYSAAEETWELPPPYPRDIDQFLHAGRPGNEEVKEERNERGELSMARPSKPKVDRSGKITVQDIAAELKIEPRDARAILRKAKITKPEGGWLGDATWAAMIKETLKKGMK